MAKRIFLWLAGVAILVTSFAITLLAIDYGLIGMFPRLGQLISP